jgi:hypothetical protein
MTNELSSFDEFNGISSCLDNTVFVTKKKMKTPIRFLDFCHNCQKNENSLGSKYLQIFAP